MKIKIDNIEKIETALDTANRGAHARIVDIDDVNRLARLAEAHLTENGSAKKSWIGTKASYVEGVLSSYGYAASSTKIEITRGSSAWFLTAAYRTTAPSNTNSATTHINASDTALDSAVAALTRRLRGAF